MTIDIVDIDDSTNEQPTQAPTGIDPQETARQIAAALANYLPKPEQRPQTSRVEAQVADMLAKGYDADAVKHILQLQMANEEDKAVRMQEAQQQMAAQNYNQKCWEMADEAVGKFEAMLPALADEDIRATILNKTSKIFKNDKDFASEAERAAQGLLPTKQNINKAVAKAVQDYCEKNGLAYKPQGLDTRSSKPAPSLAQNKDPFSGLDAKERAAAKALESTLKITSQQAAERIRAYKSA